MILKIRPDLVQMERIPDDDEGAARNLLKALREAGVQTGIWWYADHPTHYQGDARPATAEAGERLLDALTQELVQAIRTIKADDESKRLQDEFYAAAQTPQR
jgi:creatinine amidohydrolase